MWDLLLSRRFQTAIVGVVVALFIYLVPGLEGKESELSGIVGAIILTLLGSYTLDHTTYNLGKGKIDAQGANEVKVEFVDDDGKPVNPWEPYPPDTGAGASNAGKRVPPYPPNPN